MCYDTSVLTDIQRRLKPMLLTAATYDDFERNITSSYIVKRSVIGAAVTFVTPKPKPNESIEAYSKALNELASKCSYGHVTACFATSSYAVCAHLNL